MKDINELRSISNEDKISYGGVNKIGAGRLKPSGWLVDVLRLCSLDVVEVRNFYCSLKGIREIHKIKLFC